MQHLQMRRACLTRGSILKKPDTLIMPAPRHSQYDLTKGYGAGKARHDDYFDDEYDDDDGMEGTYSEDWASSDYQEAPWTEAPPAEEEAADEPAGVEGAAAPAQAAPAQAAAVDAGAKAAAGPGKKQLAAEAVVLRAELAGRGYRVDGLNDTAVHALARKFGTASDAYASELEQLRGMVSPAVELDAAKRRVRIFSGSNRYFVLTVPAEYPGVPPAADSNHRGVRRFLDGVIEGAVAAKAVPLLMTHLTLLVDGIADGEWRLLAVELEALLHARWQDVSGRRVARLGTKTLVVESTHEAPTVAVGLPSAALFDASLTREERLRAAARQRREAMQAAAFQMKRTAASKAAAAATSGMRAAAATVAEMFQGVCDDSGRTSITFNAPLPRAAVARGLGGLAALHSINLSQCGLAELPELRCRGLAKVYLSKNAFTEFPKALLPMEQLRVIDMAWNALTELPAAVGRLERLEVMQFEYNKLTRLCGFEKLRRLEVLELTDNALAGVPAEVGALEHLWRLRLSANPMVEIPPEVYHRGVKVIQEYLRELSPHNMPVPASSYAADAAGMLAAAAGAATAADVVEVRLASAMPEDDADAGGVATPALRLFNIVVLARAPRLLTDAAAHDVVTHDDGTEAVVVTLGDTVRLSSAFVFIELLHSATVPVTVLHNEVTVADVSLLVLRYGSAALRVEWDDLVAGGVADRDAALAAAFAAVPRAEGAGTVAFAVGGGDQADEEPVIVHVNRRLLCARSGYFASMFGSGLAESQLAVVPLPDVAPDVFAAFVEYVYGDAAGKKMTPDNVMALLFLCAEYSCPRLRCMAECMVGFNVDVDNAAQVLQVAHFLDSDRLKTAVMFFASTHLAAVKRTEAYQLLQPELRAEFAEKLKTWGKNETT
jgi:hypothetical protein